MDQQLQEEQQKQQSNVLFPSSPLLLINQPPPKPTYKTSYQQKTLDIITQSISQSNLTCPHETVAIWDRILNHNNNNHNSTSSSLSFLIPPIIHQTSKSRCVVPPFQQNARTWQSSFPDFDYYLHDDAAMERLIFDNPPPEFQHLADIWHAGCLTTGAMRADLWRLLVLWEYGGIFADLDSAPARLGSKDFSPSDQALFVVDKDNTTSFHFMATMPKHPLIFLTLQQAIYNVIMAFDVLQVNPVEITGPYALRRGISELLRRNPIDELRRINWEWDQAVEAGSFTAQWEDGAHLRVLGHKSTVNPAIHSEIKPNEDEQQQQQDIDVDDELDNTKTITESIKKRGRNKNRNKKEQIHDYDYWVIREVRMLHKRRWYRAMNMSHFQDTVEGKKQGRMCSEIMLEQLEQRARKRHQEQSKYQQDSASNNGDEETNNSNDKDRFIPLPELVASHDAHPEMECPPGTVPIFDKIIRQQQIPQTNKQEYDDNEQQHHDELMNFNIPRIIHQAWTSRCVSPDLKANSHTWRESSPNWEYYLHDNEAMDRLVNARIRPFAHLPLVWNNCAVVNADIRHDLWQMLVLWEYGGIVADLDGAVPRMFNVSSTILPDDYGIFVSEFENHNISLHFMAMAPRHPILFFTLQKAIRDIMMARDLDSMNSVRLAGPDAMRRVIHDMLKRTKWWIKNKMKYLDGRPLLPTTYHSTYARSQFRLLDKGPNGTNPDYWIQRPARVIQKEEEEEEEWTFPLVSPGKGEQYTAVQDDVNDPPTSVEGDHTHQERLSDHEEETEGAPIQGQRRSCLSAIMKDVGSR